MDKEVTVDELKAQIKLFCEARDWDQYHNAKDLAVGIVTEAAELLDHFRFKSKEDVEVIMKNPDKRNEISEEMADVFYFTLRLAERYNIDLSDELIKKMAKNEKKYPVEKAKGSNKKYTEF